MINWQWTRPFHFPDLQLSLTSSKTNHMFWLPKLENKTAYLQNVSNQGQHEEHCWGQESLCFSVDKYLGKTFWSWVSSFQSWTLTSHNKSMWSTLGALGRSFGWQWRLLTPVIPGRRSGHFWNAWCVSCWRLIYTLRICINNDFFRLRDQVSCKNCGNLHIFCRL